MTKQWLTVLLLVYLTFLSSCLSFGMVNQIYNQNQRKSVLAATRERLVSDELRIRTEIFRVPVYLNEIDLFPLFYRQFKRLFELKRNVEQSESTGDDAFIYQRLSLARPYSEFVYQERWINGQRVTFRGFFTPMGYFQLQRIIKWHMNGTKQVKRFDRSNRLSMHTSKWSQSLLPSKVLNQLMNETGWELKIDYLQHFMTSLYPEWTLTYPDFTTTELNYPEFTTTETKSLPIETTQRSVRFHERKERYFWKSDAPRAISDPSFMDTLMETYENDENNTESSESTELKPSSMVNGFYLKTVASPMTTTTRVVLDDEKSIEFDSSSSDEESYADEEAYVSK